VAGRRILWIVGSKGPLVGLQLADTDVSCAEHREECSEALKVRAVTVRDNVEIL
jgi:hypothetical protein